MTPKITDYFLTTNLSKKKGNSDPITYSINHQVRTSQTVNVTPRHGLTVSTLKPRIGCIVRK